MKKIMTFILFLSLITALVSCKKINYTVIIDYDNGNPIETKKVLKNKFIEIIEPVKENHTFSGWYEDDVSFDINQKITSNHFIKAKWDEIVLVKID